MFGALLNYKNPYFILAYQTIESNSDFYSSFALYSLISAYS